MRIQDWPTFDKFLSQTCSHCFPLSSTFNATLLQKPVAPFARTSNKRLAETIATLVSKRRGRPTLSAEQKTQFTQFFHN